MKSNIYVWYICAATAAVILNEFAIIVEARESETEVSRQDKKPPVEHQEDGKQKTEECANCGVEGSHAVKKAGRREPREIASRGVRASDDIYGMGYNIFLGSPQAYPDTTGIAARVVTSEAMLSNRGHNDDDDQQRRQSGSMGSMGGGMQSCKYDTLTAVVKSPRSYQEAIDRLFATVLDVKKNAARYTASRQFKEFSDAWSTHQIGILSVANCTTSRPVYPDVPDNLTDAFVNDVKQLPTTEDNNAYHGFIQKYGTHYVHDLLLGARVVVKSFMDRDVWQQLKQDGFDFWGAASASFLADAIGISSSDESQEVLQETFDNMRASYSQSVHGAAAPDDGRPESWMDAVQMPIPIGYSLASLADLFNHTSLFPGEKQQTLAAKRTQLIAAIDRFCQQLENCKVTAPDPVEPYHMLKFRHSGEVFCPDGFSPLSCGVDAMKPDLQTGTAQYVSAVPSSKSCTCRYPYEAVCVAMCSDKVKNYQIVKVTDTEDRVVYATCSDGSTPIECHMTTSYEFGNMTQANYAMVDGNRCKCRGQGSTSCYSTCATVDSKSVVEEYFGAWSKEAQVQCSSSTVLLGCGVSNLLGGVYSAAHTDNTCTCKAQNSTAIGRSEVYCYAVCGQLA
jgi:hypothetical protein